MHRDGNCLLFVRSSANQPFWNFCLDVLVALRLRVETNINSTTNATHTRNCISFTIMEEAVNRAGCIMVLAAFQIPYTRRHENNNIGCCEDIFSLFHIIFSFTSSSVRFQPRRFCFAGNNHGIGCTAQRLSFWNNHGIGCTAPRLSFLCWSTHASERNLLWPWLCCSRN